MKMMLLLAILGATALAAHANDIACPEKQFPLATAVADELPEIMAFEEWALAFGKTYEHLSGEAAAGKRAAFEATVSAIAAHNAKADAGESSFRMGVNHLSDLTPAEYSAMLSPMSVSRERAVASFTEDELAAGAKSVDWRTKGAVTPIKNQGQCGSCWAFSTTGSTEGAFFLATGELRSLSEQQLVDCSSAEGNHGCNGGLMDYGFQYIIDNSGIDGEDDYSYTAETGTCWTNATSRVVATIDGFQDVAAGDESALAAAIAKAPVSVAIEADQAAFQSYKSGVFDATCGTQLDHGVLAVGYTKDAYIVKNSWGTTWGDKGYIQMKRGVGSGGICGIAMSASYPTKAKGPAPPMPPPTPGPTPGPTPVGCNCTDSAEQTCQLFGLHACCCQAGTVRCAAAQPAGKCCCESDLFNADCPAFMQHTVPIAETPEARAKLAKTAGRKAMPGTSASA